MCANARLPGMNIPDELTPFLVPVESLSELPGNPRRGDVEAVKRSYERFGQRKPIVARRSEDGTAVVVAGNHQLKAARELGWGSIAAVWADDLSDDEARGFALADNRVADLGGYDDAMLSQLILSVSDNDDLLAASGWSVTDLDKLLGIENDLPSGASVDMDERYEIVITCNDEAEQVSLLERFIGEGLNVRGLMT